MVTQKKLDFWIKNNLNVLFIGEKGIGKSAIVIDAFERNKLKWKYYSAPTLDPMIDFCGVPRELKDKDGNPYLDLLRPKEWQDDEVEAVFFDEYNRAHKKIRNAVLELIQFKSINGRKFNNLRFIWAAVNPADSTRKYNVDDLDDAQLDRFQVHIKLPYKPDFEYFAAKFGDKGRAAIEWWGKIDEKLKYLVSPRRLDYALDHNKRGGDLRDILPSEVNVTELTKLLGTGPILDRLKNIIASKDTKGAQEIIDDLNLYSVAESHILKNDDYMTFFMPLINEERLSTYLSQSSPKINQFCCNKIKEEKDNDSGKYIDMMRNILKANTNDKACGKIKKMFQMEEISVVGKNINNNELMFKTLEKLKSSSKFKKAEREDILKDLQRLNEEKYQDTDTDNAYKMASAAILVSKLCQIDKKSKGYDDLCNIYNDSYRLLKDSKGFLYSSYLESISKITGCTVSSIESFSNQMIADEVPF